MDDTNTHEQLSALADGQLAGPEFARVVGRVGSDDGLRQRWHTYHLVGEVLRSGHHLPCSDPGRFLGRLQARLQAEAIELPRTVSAQPDPAVVDLRRHEAANAPLWRWRAVAGVASVAAVAAIGWSWMGSPLVPQGAAPQLAQGGGSAPSVLAVSTSLPRTLAGASALGMPAAPVTRVVAGPGAAPQVMLRDARLDALLAAHQQAGGAAQMPSGFLRNATFEGPSR